MSLDLTTPDAAMGRPPGPLGRVDLDWLFGSDDWIARHRCREAEIVGPLLAAESEVHDGIFAVARLEVNREVADWRTQVQMLRERMDRARGIVRRLEPMRIRLIKARTVYDFHNGPDRMVVFPVRITVEPMLLSSVWLSDTDDPVGDAWEIFLASARRLAESMASGPAVVAVVVRLLMARLLALMAEAAASARLGWPPPHLHLCRVATAGGDTCLYIPRA